MITSGNTLPSATPKKIAPGILNPDGTYIYARQVPVIKPRFWDIGDNAAAYGLSLSEYVGLAMYWMDNDGVDEFGVLFTDFHLFLITPHGPGKINKEGDESG